MKIIFKGIFDVDNLSHHQLKQYVALLETHYKKTLIALARHGYASEVKELAMDYSRSASREKSLSTVIECEGE